MRLIISNSAAQRYFFVLLAACSLLMTRTTLAFTTTRSRQPTLNTLGTSSKSKVRSASPLNALTPDHIDVMSNMGIDQINHIVSSTSNLLADAAAATADAAAEETKKGGWWSSYLEIFRNTLFTIHSTVDEPLRSVGITQTWGISIALFTISLRSLLIPLSIQQTKSSEYMKALKPYQDKIKKKLKDNQDAQNRAIAKLFEDADQNPLAGCLTSILQLPILLGLYRGVKLLAQEGRLNEPFLWIPSLEGPVTAETDYSGMSWLTEGWTPDPAGGSIPIPHLGWETTLAYLIMPVLLVLGQSITMRVLSPPMDDENMSDEEKKQMESSQTVLKFLPLLIGFFSLQVPAGLTIYWFTTNLFTLTQSLAVKGYYKANPPKIDLPDYWDRLDDMESLTPEERREAAKAGINTGPKFEDLMIEARYHYVVPRSPIRESSPVQVNGSIPNEMKDWVNSDVSSSSSKSSVVAEPEPVEVK